MTTTILPTQNTEWGFWGTISRIENDPAADSAKAWEIASRRIAEVTTASPKGVRDFLDSRHGRPVDDHGPRVLGQELERALLGQQFAERDCDEAKPRGSILELVARRELEKHPRDHVREREQVPDELVGQRRIELGADGRPGR